MERAQFLIWAIDDDPLQRMFIADELGDDWPLRLFESGDAVLAALEDDPPLPGLVLCDVLMPGVDGFSVCRKLRERDPRMQIFFLSANTDNETKLAGFDAGCDDFLGKPIDGEQLRYKAQLAERARQHHHELNAEIANVRTVAFEAMITAGELGTVLEFMRNSQECDEERELACRLLAAIEGGYGLNGSVRLRLPGQPAKDIDAGGRPCTPLGSAILDNMESMERIFSFKNRMCVNYPQITLLLHNMPVNEADRYGRLRDHLAIIVDAAERRLQNIHNARRLLDQGQAMATTMRELDGALQKQESDQHRFTLEITERMMQFGLEVQNLAIGFGLTDEQEFSLSRTVENFAAAIRRLGEEQGENNRQLAATILRLRDLLRQSSR
nr:response regulator [Chromobacterium sp. ASV5]